MFIHPTPVENTCEASLDSPSSNFLDISMYILCISYAYLKYILCVSYVYMWIYIYINGYKWSSDAPEPSRTYVIYIYIIHIPKSWMPVWSWWSWLTSQLLTQLEPQPGHHVIELIRRSSTGIQLEGNGLITSHENFGEILSSPNIGDLWYLGSA